MEYGKVMKMAKNEKHLSMRNKIIDCTIKVMQKLGFEETSVRVICDAAGISIGTFYHYFNDKTELLNLILQRIDVFLVNEIEPILKNNSELENLKLFVNYFSRDTKLTGAVYGSVISSPYIPLPSTPEAVQKERQRPLYRIPTEIILRGQKSGEFKNEYTAEEIVDFLIMSLRGCSMDWARRSCSYNIEEYMEAFIDMFSKIFVNPASKS
jgi:AcrR family transcriptional regulator